MVEDICLDIALGKTPQREWGENDMKEFKWRGWSPTGFSRRKCWHVEIEVRWFRKGDELHFEIIGRRENWGPFQAAKVKE